MHIDDQTIPGAATSAEPILTFAIPTWNRGEKLRGCVERIAKQILESRESVSIFISDNGSDDSTPQVIQDLAAQYTFIQHSRNPENLGSDRNILTVLQRAQGTYLWLFSDDDFLMDGALEATLKVIRRAKPSYIAANFYCCDEQACLCKAQPYESYMAEADIPDADVEVLFKTPCWVLGFMSRQIFRRELLRLDTYEAQLPHLRNWLQLYAVAQVVAGRNDAYLSNFYSVGNRVVEARYGNDALLKELPEAVDYILRKFHVSESTRRNSIDQIRNYFITWRSYIKYRALGASLSPLIYPPAHRFIPLLPPSLVRMGLRLKKKLR